jgi:hypothetical protein
VLTYRAAVALLAIIGLGCARSTDTRTRAYFDILRNSPVDSVSVRSAVLRMIPLGTADSEVAATLRTHGIGADSLSRYVAPESAGRAVVRVEFDPREIAVMKQSYSILLEFDVTRRLKALRVRKWIAGP